MQAECYFCASSTEQMRSESLFVPEYTPEMHAEHYKAIRHILVTFGNFSSNLHYERLNNKCTYMMLSPQYQTNCKFLK